MIYHQIEDESVVRVFETLNSRGLVVEWLDKTKSQLMALLFEHAGNAMENALKEMRSIWAGVYDTLGLDVRNGAEAMRFAGTLKRQDRPNRILGEEDASRSIVSFIVSFAQTEVDTIVGAGRRLAKVVENHNKIVSNSQLFGDTRVRHARFLATAILLRGWPDETEQTLMDKWEKVTFRIFGLADESAHAKVGDYVRLGYDIINDEKVDPKSCFVTLGRDRHRV